MYVCMYASVRKLGCVYTRKVSGTFARVSPLGLQHGQSVSFIMYAKIDSHMRNAVFELLRETRNDLVS